MWPWRLRRPSPRYWDRAQTMIYDHPLIKPAGDGGLHITFGDERSLKVNRPVRALARLVQAEASLGIMEMVPTYASLTVFYDSEKTNPGALSKRLDELARACMGKEEAETGSRLLVIPVCYESQYTPDMDYICSYAGMRPEEVVKLHTAEAYFVFQLGFTPGCPFLGPLQKELHVPLMESPRTHTPKGAVAISVGQTVIYPRATPGGMRIIGQTPVQLFQIDHPDLTLFKPGDQVQFRAVSPAEYEAIKERSPALLEEVEIIKND